MNDHIISTFIGWLCRCARTGVDSAVQRPASCSCACTALNYYRRARSFQSIDFYSHVLKALLPVYYIQVYIRVHALFACARTSFASLITTTPVATLVCVCPLHSKRIEMRARGFDQFVYKKIPPHSHTHRVQLLICQRITRGLITYTRMHLTPNNRRGITRIFRSRTARMRSGLWYMLYMFEEKRALRLRENCVREIVSQAVVIQKSRVSVRVGNPIGSECSVFEIQCWLWRRSRATVHHARRRDACALRVWMCMAWMQWTEHTHTL